jgi:hypothetical protein
VRWTSEFEAHANGSYQIRGFEVTVCGRVLLAGVGVELDFGHDTIRLSPLQNDDKVQWDWSRKGRAVVTPSEANAYQSLFLEVSSGTRTTASITGPLSVGNGHLLLAVRTVN